MSSGGGSWTSIVSDQRVPRLITAFTAPVTVSTETPLQALAALGRFYSDVIVTLRNHDGANKAALYVDQSESGAVTDADREVIYVDPLKERRVEYRDVLALMWGLSASGDPDGAFPSVNVSFQLLGRARIR